MLSRFTSAACHTGQINLTDKSGRTTALRIDGGSGLHAFTNANKALAHVMAYGRDALSAIPPRLRAGMHLPRAVLETVAASLERHGLLPRRGYLQEPASS